MTSETHHSRRHSSSSFLLFAVPLLIILLLVTVALSLSKKRSVDQYPVEGEEEVWNEEETRKESAEDPGNFVGEPVNDPSYEFYKQVMQAPAGSMISVPSKTTNGIVAAKTTVTREQVLAEWKKTLSMTPTNPSSATAKCLSTGQVIQSGVASSCPDPQFTFAPGTVRESGTQIIGYYVYFGPRNNITPFGFPGAGKAVNPEREGIIQPDTIFAPTGLQKGVYYLLVRSVSNSTNTDYALGMSIVDAATYKTRPANILFTYIYQ